MSAEVSLSYSRKSTLISNLTSIVQAEREKYDSKNKSPTLPSQEPRKSSTSAPIFKTMTKTSSINRKKNSSKRH